jgi:subtilase family serine protease
MKKVMAWLTSVGFTDVKAEKPDISYRTISSKGTVDAIERAFRTQVYSYVANPAYVLTPTIPDTTYYTNGTNLSVPEALSPVIDKVYGLSPLGIGGICNGIKMVP